MGQVFNGWLRDLGFESYTAYLNSALWAGIRSRVFAAKGRKCLRCGSKARQVHHTRYSPAIMRGDDIEPLEPICGVCHRKEHGVEHKPIRRVKKKDGTIVIPWDGHAKRQAGRRKRGTAVPTGKLPKGRKKRPKWSDTVVSISEVCPSCGRRHNVRHFPDPGGPCKWCKAAKVREEHEARKYGACSHCGKRVLKKMMRNHPQSKTPSCAQCRDSWRVSQQIETANSAESTRSSMIAQLLLKRRYNGTAR